MSEPSTTRHRIPDAPADATLRYLADRGDPDARKALGWDRQDRTDLVSRLRRMADELEEVGR